MLLLELAVQPIAVVFSPDGHTLASGSTGPDSAVVGDGYRPRNPADLCHHHEHPHSSEVGAIRFAGAALSPALPVTEQRPTSPTRPVQCPFGLYG
jgi:hypothetical protein